VHEVEEGPCPLRFDCLLLVKSACWNAGVGAWRRDEEFHKAFLAPRLQYTKFAEVDGTHSYGFFVRNRLDGIGKEMRGCVDGQVVDPMVRCKGVYSEGLQRRQGENVVVQFFARADHGIDGEAEYGSHFVDGMRDGVERWLEVGAGEVV